MSTRTSADTPDCLGFLSVVRHETHGLFGGYLLVTTTARPLEFHCTAPIKPSRAQEILYGPTLEPYLYGEQIGRTLVDTASLRPLVVLTDAAAALALRDHTELPVAYVQELSTNDDAAQPADAQQRSYRLDAAHPGATTLQPHGPLRLGPAQLTVASRYRNDRDAITAHLGPLAEYFDLTEPFGRIHAALEEAQRARR